MVNGIISKVNQDLGYGFITSNLGEVFFNEETSYSDGDFQSLKIGEKVKIKVSETSRGLFATTVQVVTNEKKVNAERSLN
jgi:cold shock CspA family protein